MRHTPHTQTLSGNDVDLITITTFASDSETLAQRRGVVVTARVHPGESNASFMMKVRGRLLFATADTGTRAQGRAGLCGTRAGMRRTCKRLGPQPTRCPAVPARG